MSKMKEVAEILGAEIWEEFKVTCSDDDYRITDSRFEALPVCREGVRLTVHWVEAPASILYDLLTGRRKIIRKPFKPKKGEEYWSVTYGSASSAEWHGSVTDLMYYAIGNCFVSKEEADANYKEVTARFEKIYADGTPIIWSDESAGKIMVHQK